MAMRVFACVLLHCSSCLVSVRLDDQEDNVIKMDKVHTASVKKDCLGDCGMSGYCERCGVNAQSQLQMSKRCTKHCEMCTCPMLRHMLFLEVAGSFADV